MSQIFPAVVVNFITYTAKRWGQFPTISYSNGAVAGAEVVTVDASLNINVQIEDAVSTNLQIKNAIEATAGSANGLSAGDLVSVAITSGHNADVNVTVKEAMLDGGTVAAKAYLTIGHLVYVAQTAGAAGNSIRVKYTSGGSLSVSVATNDITIQLKNDGSSTNALIAAAIVASGPASTLVSAKSDGLAMSFVPTVAMAPAFQALMGGTDAVAASVELQDLTFTSDTPGIAANGKKVTYVPGGTAGAEALTIDGDGNLSIEMENGVSTASQIAAVCAGGNPPSRAYAIVRLGGYTALHLSQAHATIQVQNYTALQGSGATITIAGHVLTEGVEWDIYSSMSDSDAALVIAAAVSTLTEVTGAAVGDTVNVTAVAFGSVGNAITISSSEPTNLLLSYGPNLVEGYDAAILTVNGVPLVESTDWFATVDAPTSTNSLVNAINTAPALSGIVTASFPYGDAILIDAVAIGPAGNGIPITSSSIYMPAVVAPTTDGFTNPATGTFTVVDHTLLSGATFQIGAITYTEAVDWTATGSNNNCALSIANFLTSIVPDPLVRADVVGNVVTFTAKVDGTAGNAVTMSTSDPINLVRSGPTLSGGGAGLPVVATVSGSGSNAQVTINSEEMTGGVGLNTQGFYSDQTITPLTASFVQFAYPFISRVITITNDDTSGSNKVVFSFDGTNVHGTLGFAQAVTWDVTTGKVIWLKYSTGAPAYRLIVKGD